MKKIISIIILIVINIFLISYSNVGNAYEISIKTNKELIINIFIKKRIIKNKF